MQSQVQRPYIDYYNAHLRRLADENWDDLHVLSLILAELLFRRKRHAVTLRQRVVARIIELQLESFAWPSTEAPAGVGSLDGSAWPKESLLSYMGYRTGMRGADEESRRDILDFVYAQEVPNVNSAEYMKKWGRPRTGQRLRQMAVSLANFVKNEKRRDPFAYALSIEEREADLAYLKAKYYAGRYDFVWPRTDV